MNSANRMRPIIQLPKDHELFSNERDPTTVHGDMNCSVMNMPVGNEVLPAGTVFVKITSLTLERDELDERRTRRQGTAF